MGVEERIVVVSALIGAILAALGYMVFKASWATPFLSTWVAITMFAGMILGGIVGLILVGVIRLWKSRRNH
jgi:hypothetical protein